MEASETATVSEFYGKTYFRRAKKGRDIYAHNLKHI